MPSTSPAIFKLYVSNFLTGLVFWYGIEKLFLQSIGIGAADIGWMLATYFTLALILDIPAGMLADRWSRKGMLICSIVLLAIAAIIQGSSSSPETYVIGYLFFGMYLASYSGTYHALVYDTAHSEGKANLYSRIMGRCYALFLCGAGVANIASGFIGHINLRLPFWLTLIPCIINIPLLITVREPAFHKQQNSIGIIKQFGSAVKAIAQIALLRSLILVYAGLGLSEVFKQDYGQLYYLTFNNSVILLGIFWAAYAFAWALGNALAHRMSKQLPLLVVISFGAYLLMALWHSPWALLLFLVQGIAAAAAHILIETHLQDATPSTVRASVLSVLSVSERLVRIPGSLLLGWLISSYDAFMAVNLVAAVGALGLIYWLLVGTRRVKNHHAAEASVQEQLAQI